MGTLSPRRHLQSEVEVIETSNLATLPSRHVSGYMANFADYDWETLIIIIIIIIETKFCK